MADETMAADGNGYDNGANDKEYQDMLKYQAYLDNKKKEDTEIAKDNSAASKEKLAASDASKATSIVGAGLNAVPVWGTIAGAAVAGGGAIASGALEADASKKQNAAAKLLQQQAKEKQAAPLAPGFQQHTTADENASNSDVPGLETAKDSLLQNFVAHMRAIKESSPTGGHAVNAISNSLGLENQSLNALMAENANFKDKNAQKFRDDLWNMGIVKHQGEQELFNNYQKPLFEQATALTNAGTANKQTAINTIGGAVSNAGVTALNGYLKQKNITDNANQLALNQQIQTQRDAITKAMPDAITPRGATSITSSVPDTMNDISTFGAASSVAPAVDSVAPAVEDSFMNSASTFMF